MKTFSFSSQPKTRQHRFFLSTILLLRHHSIKRGCSMMQKYAHEKEARSSFGALFRKARPRACAGRIPIGFLMRSTHACARSISERVAVARVRNVRAIGGPCGISRAMTCARSASRRRGKTAGRTRRESRSSDFPRRSLCTRPR